MAIKFVLVEIVLVETVLVGDPLYIVYLHHNLVTSPSTMLHSTTLSVLILVSYNVVDFTTP